MTERAYFAGVGRRPGMFVGKASFPLLTAFPNGWDDPWNLPPEDEQHAIKVLFALLDEFAAEREAAQDSPASD